MSRFLAHYDEQGRIVPVHPERFVRRAGREVWVETHNAPTIGLRSDPSNNYLWGVVYKAIMLETGNDPDSIHYGLKREALRVGILEPQYILLGDKLVEDDPTTRTDQDTFNLYVNWIREGAE